MMLEVGGGGGDLWIGLGSGEPILHMRQEIDIVRTVRVVMDQATISGAV